LLEGADVVIVHEWNPPELVERLGRHRARGRAYRLLFHDTHHRAVSAPDDMDQLPLDGYDGILAFGEVVRQLYLRRGWARRAWTWHEAADVRRFRPIAGAGREGDLVWVGNWGDGVRYPEHARRAVAAAGADYGGWLPNHRVPEVFARYAVTVHVPRRPYVQALAGIPTIRVFEALACGIPLVSAPWSDCEGLFRPEDMLSARDGADMISHLRAVLADPELAHALAQSGLETIRSRHTCSHRVDQLLEICAELGAPARLPEVA
jgi:spore maturation protein CgeB